MAPSSTAGSFPDKKREPNSFGGPIKSSPTARLSGHLLARRMKSVSGYSSSDEGSSSFRRMTSFGSATDSCNSLKFAVCTPNYEEGKENDPLPTHDMLMEMTREAQSDDNRPPSPRPTKSRDKFIEHNKQVHVWDDWMTLNSAVESDVASITYKRSPSKHGPKSLPKTLGKHISDNSDY